VTRFPANARSRRIAGSFYEGLCAGVAFLTLAALAWLLGGIARGGWGTISWEFLTRPPENGMTAGGIFPAIFGPSLTRS
jgi:phosphate transport system permease protein